MLEVFMWPFLRLLSSSPSSPCAPFSNTISSSSPPTPGGESATYFIQLWGLKCLWRLTKFSYPRCDESNSDLFCHSLGHFPALHDHTIPGPSEIWLLDLRNQSTIISLVLLQYVYHSHQSMSFGPLWVNSVNHFRILRSAWSQITVKAASQMLHYHPLHWHCSASQRSPALYSHKVSPSCQTAGWLPGRWI